LGFQQEYKAKYVLTKIEGEITNYRKDYSILVGHGKTWLLEVGGAFLQCQHIEMLCALHMAPI